MAEISNHLINVIFQATGGEQTAANITKIKTALGGIAPSTKDAANKMGDLERAMRRAVIVAPVWMAIRQAMQFVTNGIKEGIDYMVQFEKQILLVKQALIGIGAAAVNIEKMKESIIKLSQETGKSTAEITKNYLEIIKASRTYIGATDAATIATMAQEVAQSDSIEITKALALAVKIQGESWEKGTSQQEKYKEVAESLYALSTRNLVSFEDLAKEYSNFAATGDAANLTFQETAAILATLNSVGVQNVQGLKTALLRTLADSEKIAKELGINITPDTKPFELFIDVLNKFRGAATGGANMELFGALGELYGKGGRGGATIIKVLSDTVGELNDNLKVTQFPVKNAHDFAEALKEVQDSLPHQLELLQNLKKQAFEAFVIGITGGKDFNDGLKNLNNTIKENIESLHIFGEYWHGIMTLLSSAKYAIPGVGLQMLNEDVGKAMQKGANDKLAAQTELHEKIIRALHGELSLQDTVRVMMEVKNTKLIEDTALRKNLQIQLEKEAILLRDTRDLEEKKKNTIEQTVITRQKSQKEIDKEHKLLETLQSKILKDYDKQVTLISNIFIQNEEELLRIRGATEAQIIAANMVLNNTQDIETRNRQLLEQKLALEVEITKEKLHQDSLSERTMKLFEISKKYGVGTAAVVGQFLQGNIGYAEFEKLANQSKELQQIFMVMKNQFPEIFKTEEAKQYLFGTAEGANIPIGEREAINQMGNMDVIKKEAQRQAQINVTLSIPTLNINVDSEKAVEKIREQLMEQLPGEIKKHESEIKKAIDDLITEY